VLTSLSLFIFLKKIHQYYFMDSLTLQSHWINRHFLTQPDDGNVQIS
jgi:hypothetical protein